tara:strand:- start:26 stop:628 length:603 start_codon:yes stop_codon:yes gene_type:complete
MFKNIPWFISIIIVLSSNIGYTQNNTDIRIESVIQNGNKIDIKYNIDTKWFIKNHVSLYTRRKGSKIWEGPLNSTYGNIKENTSSGSNSLTWNVTSDREKFSGQWVFGIDNNISLKKNIKNLKVTCGLFSLAGFAVGTYGYLKSEDYYSQYQNSTTNAALLREKDNNMIRMGILGAALGSILIVETSILSRKIKKVKRTL